MRKDGASMKIHKIFLFKCHSKNEIFDFLQKKTKILPNGRKLSWKMGYGGENGKLLRADW